MENIGEINLSEEEKIEAAMALRLDIAATLVNEGKFKTSDLLELHQAKDLGELTSRMNALLKERGLVT